MPGVIQRTKLSASIQEAGPFQAEVLPQRSAKAFVSTANHSSISLVLFLLLYLGKTKEASQNACVSFCVITTVEGGRRGKPLAKGLNLEVK